MKVLFVSSGNHGTLNQRSIHHGTKRQIDSLINQGLRVEVYLIVGKGFWGYLHNILKIRQTIKRGNYDIIHAIGGHSGLAVILSLMTRNLCISYLGSDVQGFDSTKIIQNILNKILSKIIRLSSLIPKGVIVKSQRMMFALPGKVKDKCHIIPNGVDFEVFKPFNMKIARKELNLDLNKKVVLFLGDKSCHNKNFSLIQEAFKFLENTDTELVAPFPVHNSSIPKYLNAADVLVLTSYKEGSPNVVKEAMACNCPIISTDVGDVKDIISNTENCFITGYDATELSILIEKVLKMASRTNGRSMINSLSEQHIASNIISVYNEICIKRH
jgi:teichuronic acid biosynthesis glycosyltransferase TuaC